MSQGAGWPSGEEPDAATQAGSDKGSSGVMEVACRGQIPGRLEGRAIWYPRGGRDTERPVQDDPSAYDGAIY